MSPWTVERLDAAPSTMDAARERARAGAPDGTVVVARTQGTGRGLRGRAWHSPEGGLYLSVVLRGLEDPRLLTLALGNAVAEVLETAGAEPGLKWVNDAWVDGRKVAGVLVEAESTGGQVDFLVAGLGVNVNGTTKDWPGPLDRLAVTLEEVLGADTCMEDLETLLLEVMEAWVERVRRGRREEVLKTWRARDVLAGREVAFDPEGGEGPRLLGTARGIDDEGRFLLEMGGEVRAFGSGRVLVGLRPE